LLYFRSLASGSSGNAYLLRTGKVTLLFECGLTMPKLTKCLSAEGLYLRDLSAIFVSHEHRDHCLSVREASVEGSTPVCANIEVLRAMGVHDLATSQVVDVGRPALLGDVEVTGFPVLHDAVSPVGYLIRTDHLTVVLATDLGDESPALGEAMRLADLIVLEANHDVALLHGGSYPYQLQRRVSSSRGHLSNSQAGNIISKYVKSDEVEIWLAHLSKVNNTPKLAVQTVGQALLASGRARLTPRALARDKPSLRWNGTTAPHQLSLFDPI
jgi:phosphoribosyl 1,2-cyclic phosphodiesterase